MKKLRTYWLFISLITGACTSIFSQQKVITLSSPVSGSQTYEARDQVVMQPGFSYTPVNTQFLNAKINENLIVDVEYQASVDPSTRALDTTLPVGTSTGGAGVSSNGAATYTLPIFITPRNRRNTTSNFY